MEQEQEEEEQEEQEEEQEEEGGMQKGERKKKKERKKEKKRKRQGRARTSLSGRDCSSVSRSLPVRATSSSVSNSSSRRVERTAST